VFHVWRCVVLCLVMSGWTWKKRNKTNSAFAESFVWTAGSECLVTCYASNTNHTVRISDWLFAHFATYYSCSNMDSIDRHASLIFDLAYSVPPAANKRWQRQHSAAFDRLCDGLLCRTMSSRLRIQAIHQGRLIYSTSDSVWVCVCVCVRERERERERDDWMIDTTESWVQCSVSLNVDGIASDFWTVGGFDVSRMLQWLKPSKAVA